MKLIINKYFYIAFTWSFLGLWELMGAIKGYQPSWWMVIIPMLSVLGNKWFDYIVFTACEDTIMKRVNEDHKNGDTLNEIKETFFIKTKIKMMIKRKTLWKHKVFFDFLLKICYNIYIS